jgi:hypothetical protein
MVQDDEPVGLDGLRVEFDDERAVSDAGVMLVASCRRESRFAGTSTGATEVGPAVVTSGIEIRLLPLRWPKALTTGAEAARLRQPAGRRELAIELADEMTASRLACE